MSAASTLAPDNSGVYRTPADLDALKRHAAASGAVWLEADLQVVRDKYGLLRTFTRVLRFPGDFGNNWDALADSLQDLSWCASAAYVLHLRNPGTARREIGETWHMLLEILRESAMYWKVHGKPFVVIVDDAEDLPAWL